MGKNQHVVSLGNRWAVKEEGAAEPFAVFKTQSEAWEKAKSIARKERTEAFLHGETGRSVSAIPTVRIRPAIRADAQGLKISAT